MRKYFRKIKKRIDCNHVYVDTYCPLTKIYLYSECECGRKNCDFSPFGI